MDEFCTPYYFALEQFRHAALFESIEFVWEALPSIAQYLDSLELGKIEGDVSDQAYLVNPELITIGRGSVVEPGAYIKGPCVLGEGCSVRHGAYIRGNVLCGDKVVIGHATEAKNALFLDGAQAGHFAYVGDSILGSKVNLGAGTKLANLKLDGRSVKVRANGKSVDSGLRKFGAILGDRVQLGCNSVTNPGTLMGKDSSLWPCATAHGLVPQGKAAGKGNRVISGVRS